MILFQKYCFVFCFLISLTILIMYVQAYSMRGSGKGLWLQWWLDANSFWQSKMHTTQACSNLCHTNITDGKGME